MRDTWLSRVFETLGQDMRYGLRNLRRNPGFALVVIATMALGIGANTAIFSVVNSVLLRPLPYEGGDRLVVLRQQRPLAGDTDISFSPKEIADYGTQTAGLEGVAEFHSMWFILLGRAEPERVSTGVVSANFFPLLGVKPMLGRSFTHEDERVGSPAVLILSHKYWQRSFGGDPSIVGRVFQMNDRPHEVVGVLPAITEYPEEVDVYMPTSACPFRSSKRMVETRSMRMVGAFGKIRKGVTLDKARADIAVVASRLAKDYPDDYPSTQGYQTVAIPLQEELTRSFKTTLLVLLGTAGVRSADRVREHRQPDARANGQAAARDVGPRGARRQPHAAAAAVADREHAAGRHRRRARPDAGWLGSRPSGRVRRAIHQPRGRNRNRPDGPALHAGDLGRRPGWCSEVFRLLPAASDRPLRLRAGTRSTQTSHGLRSSLIVVQVAVSFMLLIGAGLTVRTLINLQQVDPGFRTDDILTSRLDLNFTKYRDPFGERAPFWERLEERLRADPGGRQRRRSRHVPAERGGPVLNVDDRSRASTCRPMPLPRSTCGSFHRITFRRSGSRCSRVGHSLARIVVATTRSPSSAGRWRSATGAATARSADGSPRMRGAHG